MGLEERKAVRIWLNDEGRKIMRKTMFALITSATVALSAQAMAVDEPANIIKYRQAVMKAIGGHTGAIVGVAKGEVSFIGHVAAHARAIHDMSKLIPDLFPKGSDRAAFAETRALPDIWADWAKFEAAARKLQEESARMIQVAEGGGDAAAIGAQLQNMGKACGGCHKPFRAEKK
ncbi:MAG: cytochrome c [Alphaproteobacteria bacterium]|nr:MAG: cytochrome c [Alphaproteobacteria bacterium]